MSRTEQTVLVCDVNGEVFPTEVEGDDADIDVLGVYFNHAIYAGPGGGGGKSDIFICDGCLNRRAKRVAEFLRGSWLW